MKPKTFHKVSQTRTAKMIDEIMEELCYFLYIWMHVTLLLRLITRRPQPLSWCSDLISFLNDEVCPLLMWNLKFLERDQITVRYRYRGLAKAALDPNLA